MTVSCPDRRESEGAQVRTGFTRRSLSGYVRCISLQTAPDGWKNSVRHNLSLNKCFEKVENKMSGSSRKGCLWALNLARIDKMEEEMHKWKRKDLAAIHRSMANPGEAWIIPPRMRAHMALCACAHMHRRPPLPCKAWESLRYDFGGKQVSRVTYSPLPRVWQIEGLDHKKLLAQHHLQSFVQKHHTTQSE